MSVCLTTPACVKTSVVCINCMILYTPTSIGCSKDYIRLYPRNRLISELGGSRFCRNVYRGHPLNSEIYTDFMTVYFHTDGSGNGGSGLNIRFTAIGKL